MIMHTVIFQLLVSIHTDDTDMELATRDIHNKMRRLVESFIAHDVCRTLGDSVDSLRGVGCYMILIPYNCAENSN